MPKYPYWDATLLLELTLLALLQMAVWAAVLVLCGEFVEYTAAFYHSAVNFTTLGYGDIVMSERWRVLGPLEAVNGILMLGLSASMLYATFTRIGQAMAEQPNRGS
ncbi:potassium channel family protein [Thiohalomonas denitrificans]|uniref:potassium channel family protein n=1 Tax=Thiohalomonas denitrificans TaxID=415747 RepID=UPI0026F33E89|nr:potassium channel family protein [Thiohalomonas denitrificans]